MTAPTTARRPGPNLWLSIGVIAIGVLLEILPAYKFATVIIDTVVSPATVHVPGQERIHLRQGKYIVFQRTGTTTGGGGISFTRDNGISLAPSMVSVTSSSGGNVDVGFPGSTQTITRGSHRYTGAVEFHAPSDGDYDIRIAAPPQPDVLVTRSLGDTFRSLLVWLVLGGVAFLVFAGGVALLIVGEVRRHRKPPPPPPLWSPPPPPHPWSPG